MKYILFISILMNCMVFSFADNVELALQDITAIQDSAGLTRILFKINIDGLPDTAKIDYAQLIIPRFLKPLPKYSLTLETRLLIKSWEVETVTWDYPWENGGADYDTTLVSHFRVSSEVACNVKLDLTDYLKLMLTGTPNYGLLLTTPDYEKGGFIIYGNGLLEVLKNARVEIGLNPALIEN